MVKTSMIGTPEADRCTADHLGRLALPLAQIKALTKLRHELRKKIKRDKSGETGKNDSE